VRRGGEIIACIEDPMVIEKILTRLNLPSASTKPAPATRLGFEMNNVVRNYS
jgi:hypothetical protein